MITLPFEQIYAQMQQAQSQKDTFDTMTGLMPKHLQADTEDAKVYRDMVDAAVEGVTNAFASGNTKGALRMLHTAQRDLMKAWQPGGLANALEQRYAQAQEAQKAISEHTQDFKQPHYAAYFENQLQNQIGRGTGYNPDTGSYNTISTPQMVDEVILADEVDKLFKDWAVEQNVNIEQSPDGYWYYKHTRERVPASELQQAMSSFMRQPHIQTALGIQGWYKANSIPQEMRPQILDAYRQSYRQQAYQRVNEQARQLSQMDEVLRNGRSSDIQGLQQELQAKGFDVRVTGEVDEATRNAVESYQQAVGDDLRGAMSMIDQRIEQMPLEGFMQQEIVDDLEGIYVPKWTRDVHDIDMIANTPLLTRMRISAQERAIKGLTSELIRPRPTIAAPSTVEPTQLLDLSQLYNSARSDYQEAENTMTQGLSPAVREVIMMRPQGQELVGPNRQQGSPSLTHNAHAIHNALQATMQEAGTFDPEVYREKMAMQGYRLNDYQLQQHSSVLSSRDGAEAVAAFADHMTPLYTQVEATGDVYRSFVDRVVQNEDLIDWDRIAHATGQFRIEDEYPVYYPEMAKAAFQRGDRRVQEAVMKWANDHNPAVYRDITGATGLTMYYNEALEPFREDLEGYMRTNLVAAIDRSNVSPDTMEKLGLDEDGVVLDSDGKPVVEIQDVQLGIRNLNGRNQMTALVKTSASEAPVAVGMDQINREWIREAVRTGAASSMNPENPGEVMYPEAFSMFAGMLYDTETRSGTAFNANLLTRKMDADNYGPLGLEVVNMMGVNTEVQTFYLPLRGRNGDVISNHLITLANPYIIYDPENPQDNWSVRDLMTKGYITDEDLQRMNNDPRSNGFSTRIEGGGYEAAKNAIYRSKSTFTEGLLRQDILTHPYRYRTTTNNATDAAQMIGSSIMWDF